MGNFAIQFLISNIFISIIIGILFAARRILKRCLTSRMQYNLWFFMFGCMAVPFLPAVPAPFLQFFTWLKRLRNTPVSSLETVSKDRVSLIHTDTSGWMNDFGETVSQNIPSSAGLLLFALWAAGVTGMILYLLKSALSLHALKKSSLPLQNPAIHRLYQNCCKEMHITKDIPVYSSAYLKSPVIAGFLKPCIYLPIHSISDDPVKDIRFMLLHELTHYRYKDCLVNYFMNAACTLYWFNPFVWLALKEMKSDREIACDTSVLKMLDAGSYAAYGTALINFAEKISHPPFPFASGISGNMAQMRKRIVNIAAFEKDSIQKPSFRKTFYGLSAYALTAVILSVFLPLLSIRASSQSRYAFPEYGKTVTYPDLSASFGSRTGSFVLYDAENDTWQIYNKNQALTRITPVSTYKIYSALFALEEGMISPEQTFMKWNGRHYVYDEWNAGQTLASAMKNSVTWYFQTFDLQAGFPAIRNFLQKTGYGSQTAEGDLSSYWADSSLVISPVEQVEMLVKFYYNLFDFAPENIDAVKDAIYLNTKGGSSIYGKTGTGAENGRNTLGWFVGYVKQDGHTYFFATNIQDDETATGSMAADLTFSILSELNIWQT